MRYAQIKGSRKLHLVFEAEGTVSQPICGIRADHYRMTCNVPLAHACKNCMRIYRQNGGAVERRRFFSELSQGEK